MNWISPVTLDYTCAVGASEEIRDEVVQFWGQMAAMWAIPAATAKVFAWLLTEVDDATAEQIAEGLGMSRGAVSQACRELREWGLVTALRPAGTRKTYYRPETDPETCVRSIVKNRKRREWDPVLEHLDDWMARLSGARTKDAALIAERLAGIHAQFHAVNAVAEVFLNGGVVRSLGMKMLVSTAEKARKKQVSEQRK